MKYNGIVRYSWSVDMVMRLFRGIHKRLDILKYGSFIELPPIKSCEVSIIE